MKDADGISHQAPLFYVSPGQVNYQVPAGTSSGNATITVTAADGTASSAVIPITPVAPGLFTVNADGLAAATLLRLQAGGAQSAEAVFQLDSATQQIVPLPIDLGPATAQVYLIVFGTGFRFHQRELNVELAGTPTQVQYAGPQGFFAGLDQMNLLLPRISGGVGKGSHPGCGGWCRRQHGEYHSPITVSQRPNLVILWRYAARRNGYAHRHRVRYPWQPDCI